jgi:hypothetical protein
MQYKKKAEELSSDIERLFNNSNEENIKECGQLLKTYIELLVWKQFRDSFVEILFKKNERELYFKFEPDKINIVVMYELLILHINSYEEMAENKNVITDFSSTGNGPLKEMGKICAIPISLPKEDYSYLMNIQDEKDNIKESLGIIKSRFEKIYENILFVKNNSTFPQIRPNKSLETIDDKFKFIHR